MKKIKIICSGNISINKTYEAEPIEIEMMKVTEKKEPIVATAPIIYTDRKDGVLPEYDIRTDRFEIAYKAMGHVSKAEIAKRNKGETKKVETKEDGKTESLQGTD